MLLQGRDRGRELVGLLVEAVRIARNLRFRPLRQEFLDKVDRKLKSRAGHKNQTEKLIEEVAQQTPQQKEESKILMDIEDKTRLDGKNENQDSSQDSSDDENSGDEA